VQESATFLSGNARLVRAGVNMLVAAWRNAPSTSILPNYTFLSQITGLTESEVHEHWTDLTQGWELRDGRLVHCEMQSLCDCMFSRHGETLTELSIHTAVIAQGPEEFVLTPPEVKTSKAKGKHKLPAGWEPNSVTLDHLAAKGYKTPEMVADLVQKMSDWASGKGEMRHDWQATLRNFASNTPVTTSISTFKDMPFIPPGANSRFSALGKSGVAREVNRSVMAAVRGPSA
jgi:hypothetical protein